MSGRYIWGIGVGCLLGGIVYFSFNPETNALFPKCPFRVLTGWLCPGCGSQRAIHALLHGNLLRAFNYNALLVTSIPVVCLLLYAEMKREKRPRFYGKVHSVVFIWGCFVVVLLWWIIRNIIKL